MGWVNPSRAPRLLLKDLVSRKLLKSNQLGTSVLFGIANEHNCFKIQISACIDNFEQYFQASILKTRNDLESFIIIWKVFTPLKNNRLKLSVVSGLLNMLYGKKSPKTRKHRKSTDSFVKQRIPMGSFKKYVRRAEGKGELGGGQAYLYVRSVKKIDWFSKAGRVLSDKLLSSC